MNWIPRPERDSLRNGDAFLVAVAVCRHGLVVSKANRNYWELTVVTVDCDECHFSIRASNDDVFGWGWEDIEWVVPVRELTGMLPSINLAEARKEYAT